MLCSGGGIGGGDGGEQAGMQCILSLYELWLRTGRPSQKATCAHIFSHVPSCATSFYYAAHNAGTIATRTLRWPLRSVQWQMVRSTQVPSTQNVLVCLLARALAALKQWRRAAGASARFRRDSLHTNVSVGPATSACIYVHSYTPPAYALACEPRYPTGYCSPRAPNASRRSCCRPSSGTPQDR